MDRTAMLTSKLKVVFLLNVLASSILAAGDEVYGKDGGEITLSPGSLSGPLYRIVWKRGDDKAIEWEGGITDAYHQFKGSTSLNKITGEMTITNLDSRFNGVYSSDVNGIQATKKWKLTVLSDEVYGKDGGEITLSPGSLSGPLHRIVWKHGGDKAIELEGGITDAYRQFKGSTSLNETTGEMRITKLDSTFNGVYSSDVNGIQATKKWKLTVLDPVSKPIIVENCNESMCVLSCENTATVEVQCAWRNGEEELRQSDGTLVLEKSDDTVGKAYICNCRNPVSFAVSDPVVPFPRGDEVYGKKGGEITLSPGSLSGSLTRIVWKHGDDKAIEWEGGQTDAYRQFRGSTSLNETTGEMRITKLDSMFNGVYSSDVNGIQATKRWTLTVLDPVSKPRIVLENCTESMCVLTCKSNTTFKVQYAWRNDEEELRQSGGTLKLEKTDDTVGKAYTCIFRNPVSSAESDEVIPFPKPKPLVEIIVGLLSGLFILLGVIAFIKRKQLMKFVQTCRGTRGNSDADKGGAKDPEAVLLNKNAAGNQDGANETSEVPETLDNTIDDKAAPLTPTNGDKPPN